MVVLINPYTGKPVDASGDSVKVLTAAGFVPVEVEKPKRKPGRPKKSE